ncbi:uroporphyrinogen decarboxylase family protein [[Eubacterium] cellulosolvens]
MTYISYSLGSSDTFKLLLFILLGGRNIMMPGFKRSDKAIVHPGEKYTPRERVWKILDHQEADRVPAELGGCMSFITKQAYFRLKHYLNLQTFPFEIDYWPSGSSYNPWWLPPIDETIYRLFRTDFRPISLRYSRPFVPKKMFPDNSFIDELGFHRKAGETYMEFANPAPLESAQDVDEILSDPYWLDPEKDFTAVGLEKKAKKMDDAGFAVCVVNIGGSGIFENSWMRRGFSKIVEDMYLNPKIAETLLDKVTDQMLTLYSMMLDEVGDYVTMVATGDDLGAQTSILLKPDIYRKFLKPRHKKLFDLIHKKTKAKLYYHSCGNMKPFIPDLIEIGADVLNPIQPECPDMDLETLKKEYGEKLTFCGGIGSQSILPKGSIQDVEIEVVRAIKAGASGGGYIIAPGHMIQPDVPPWNIEALYSAAIKYGTYPINL